MREKGKDGAWLAAPRTTAPRMRTEFALHRRRRKELDPEGGGTEGRQSRRGGGLEAAPVRRPKSIKFGIGVMMQGADGEV